MGNVLIKWPIRCTCSKQRYKKRRGSNKQGFCHFAFWGKKTTKTNKKQQQAVTSTQCLSIFLKDLKRGDTGSSFCQCLKAPLLMPSLSLLAKAGPKLGAKRQGGGVGLHHSPPSSLSCLKDFKCRGLFILKIPKAFVSVIATCVTNSIFVSWVNFIKADWFPHPVCRGLTL